jgi:carbon starvation protein CstA
VDLRRLRLQEYLAGAFGIVLLVSTFLDWYGGDGGKASAWEKFGALDVMLAVVGLMAIGLTVAAAMPRGQAVSVAIGALLVLIGLVTSVWLIFRVVKTPGDMPDREVGLWLGLVSCVGVTVAGLWSIRDDRFPRAVADAGRVDVTPLPAPPREGAGAGSS